VLVGSAAFEEGGAEGVAFVLDLTERKRSEAEARDSDRRYRDVQMELAHASRVATIGQLTTSIAHEVNQPIAAAVINSEAALGWLDAEPPDLGKARQALGRIVESGARAREIIRQMRDFTRKAPQSKNRINVNDVISDIVSLSQGEATKNEVAVRTQLADGLQPIEGDRVQLQQVILNLVMNAIEAMSGSDEAARELLLTSEEAELGRVRVAVLDTGPGLGSVSPDRLFNAFHTTKPNGLGLGLSICRSIIEAHGGKLSATANSPRGAVFQFVVPTIATGRQTID
jgi:C4-dicarboxylate-specific signal transduction histidine kinase